MFSDEALAQIARYYRLAGARRCHEEGLGGAGRELAFDLLDGCPLELVQDDAGDIVLMIFGRPGIYFFDRAAKPIYSWSLAGGRTRGALHFRIRRWLPQVRELFLIVFAGQRGCLFPHLRVSYCWIKECRTSLDRTINHSGSYWFVARMGRNSCPADVREQYHAHMHSELYGPAMAGGVFAGDPLDLWERDAAMRERVRPVIADEAKSQQFLAAKRLALNPD